MNCPLLRMRIRRYRQGQSERFLSPKEYRRLGEVLHCHETDHPFHVAEVRLLLLTSSRGRRRMVVVALRRMTGFFRSLMRIVVQLRAGCRWCRIPAEALKMYLRRRQPGRPFWIPPAWPARPGCN